MPKRREPKATSKDPNLETRIQEFADAADQHTPQTPATLDPDAPRNHKAIRVPFNEYEYKLLDKAAKQARRSKLDFIRLAIQALADRQKTTPD